MEPRWQTKGTGMKTKADYFEEGRQANYAGKGDTMNPYVYGTNEYGSWERGWKWVQGDPRGDHVPVSGGLPAVE